MIDLGTIRVFLRYNDWADGRVFDAASALSDEALDQRMEMGPGTLRRTLLHIYHGESVWLSRWMGEVETPWPPEAERVGVAEIRERLERTWSLRESFSKGLGAGTLERVQPYRDSRGSLFRASLGDMMVQMCIHSIHHRAQAVNMLRRAGVGPVELDYMMWVRRPV